MDKILTILNKELKVTFCSPIAYILLCIAMVIFNVFFFIIIDQNREATLRDMFVLMEFMLVFMIPLISMKSIAQEKEIGTMEFLMTTPTTNTAIVTGKYLGVLGFLSIMILMTVPYYFIMEIYGDPDRLAMLLGYFGIWLEGAFFLAIGVMTSSWTKSQVLAAMCSYLIILSLYFSVSFTTYLNGFTKELVQYLNVMTHSSNLFNGLLNTADLVYFVSGIIICLLITRTSINNRIWQ